MYSNHLYKHEISVCCERKDIWKILKICRLFYKIKFVDSGDLELTVALYFFLGHIEAYSKKRETENFDL